MPDARDRAGRPPHQVTTQRQQTVQVMHANGVPQRIIAKVIGCDLKTLRRHYRQELNDAHDQVEAAMGAAIVKAAQDGAWGAAKYWLQSHGKDDRWRTPEQHRIAGDPDAPPIQVSVSIEDMTDDQIRERIIELEHRSALADRIEGSVVVSALPAKPNGVEH